MRTEFPAGIHDEGVDDIDRCDRFMGFADRAMDEIVDALVGTGPDAKLGEALIDDLRLSHARFRTEMADAREGLKTVSRKRLAEHWLIGPFLTFKTRAVEAIWGAARSEVAPQDKRKTPVPLLSVAERVIGPVATLVTSIFQACGLTPPSEFLATLKHLIGHANRQINGPA